MVTIADVRPVQIGTLKLQALLGVPERARGLVIFAHGSGSGRLSPRNNHVAAALREGGLATLLLDLLTPSEELDRHNVFDIPLLASRLVLATEWVSQHSETKSLRVGYFGASTGAGAALFAAARAPRQIHAVVSRGGRPDLAGATLADVRAPTLLIVGSRDEPVIGLNRQAQARLTCETDLVIVPGASHLFEEPGTLDIVVQHAMRWFRSHLGGQGGGLPKEA
jgi:putative phosphoribosyl transferase